MQRRNSILVLLFVFIAFKTFAQNTSPFWSVAGNSNANSVSKLGTTTADPLNLTTNNTTRLRIATDGKVGIGTTSPQQLFHVEGSTLLSIFVSTSPLSNISGSGMIGYTKFLPTASGQRLGYFLLGSRGGAENNYNAAGMVGYAAGAWTAGSSYPTYLAFETTPSGSTSRVERLRIDQNGHLLPGTTRAYDLGSNSLSWRNLYLRDDIYLDGTRFVSNAPGTASFNAFVGSGSGLSVSDGIANTAVGDAALRNTTTGTRNSVLGRQALYSNQGGSSNVAIGNKALFAAVNNSNNIAIGDSTLYAYDDFGFPDYIVAVGHNALTNTTTGFYNTAVGGFSLLNNQTGYYNTAVGLRSMETNIDGSSNTVIGAGANVNSGSLTNATVLGAFASVDASNKVRVGNNNITSIGGQVNWTAFSDGRYKKNIKEDVQGLSFINALRPVTYTVDVQGLNTYYNKGTGEMDERRGVNAREAILRRESEEKASKIVYNGFVAQEVEQAAKKLNYIFSGIDKPQKEGGLYGLRYSDFVVPLVKAVQELDQKTKRIEELENQVAELRQMVLEIRNGRSTIPSFSSAYLEQSAPNPARGATIIRYGIPDGTTAARLTLTNAKGQLLKELSLSGRGAGQVTLNTVNLPAGTYTYTLWVNGQQADSKQLVIAR